MENKLNDETKKPGNKKNFWSSSLLFVLVCGTCGGLGGYFSTMHDKIDAASLTEKINAASPAVLNVLDWIIFSVSIVVFVIASVIYFTQKKKAEKLMAMDECDDGELESITYKLNFPMLLPCISVFFVIFSMVYTVVIKHECAENFGGKAGTVEFIVKFAVFWIILLMCATIIKGTIKTIKKINPEKKGEIYSFTFGKDWMNSCDEGEKLIQYKAAWKTQKFVVSALMLIWCASFFYMIIFKKGVFMCILFMILFLSTLLVNGIEVMKMEKPGK